MSSHDELPAWLKIADNDLDTCRCLIDLLPRLASVVCFHAQQATEKNIKAVMVSLGLPVRKADDNIGYLLDQLPQDDRACFDSVAGLRSLSNYNEFLEEPDYNEHPTSEQALQSIAMAEAAREIARTILARRDITAETTRLRT